MTFFINIRQYRAKEGDLTENINAEEVIDNYKSAKKGRTKYSLFLTDADPSVPKWKTTAYYSVVLFGRWSIIPREED